MVDKGQKRQIRNGMATVMSVAIREFKDELKMANISASDKEDSIRKAIERAIDGLTNKGITSSYEYYIWLTVKSDKVNGQ